MAAARLKATSGTVTVRIAENGFATSRSVNKSAKVVLGRVPHNSLAVTHRDAKLMLPIITTAATSPALANTPDTTAALNRITPNAYAILSSAHRITPMKRPNTQ